ncbi:MAG TPA: response regulator [Caldimonas sp.]
MDDSPRAQILVAEDNPISRDLLMYQLQVLGRDAIAVRDGSEAIAAWRSGDFGLLLTDHEMPGMSGCELACLVRGGSWRPDAPIVLLTAGAATGDSMHAGALIDEVLIKPASMATLREVLEKWLGPVRAAEPAPRAAAAR